MARPELRSRRLPRQRFGSRDRRPNDDLRARAGRLDDHVRGADRVDRHRDGLLSGKRVGIKHARVGCRLQQSSDFQRVPRDAQMGFSAWVFVPSVSVDRLTAARSSSTGSARMTASSPSSGMPSVQFCCSGSLQRVRAFERATRRGIIASKQIHGARHRHSFHGA